MSVLSLDPVGYRCSRCFNINCSTSDQVGTQVECPHCSTFNEVPEATPERVQQGLQYHEQFGGTKASVVKLDDEMSDAQIYAEARKEARATAAPASQVCSLTRRFVAALVDSFAVMVAATIGLVAVMFSGFTPEAFEAETFNMLVPVVMLTPMIMLSFVQWVMTAMDGRTIGKYCLNIKIVNALGNPPGILQGIILRCWLTGLLGLIPFFSILDVFVIFSNDTNRCIHDFYSGTYVVEAS